MNSRRSFLRFLGLSPVVGVGAVASTKAALASTANPLDAPPPGNPILTLTGGMSGRNAMVSTVGMQAGKDGYLWLKIGDKWRRVVVE